MAADEHLSELRRQLSEVDRSLVDAVNARLELVARIKEYKEAQGIAFLDPEQEERSLAVLTDANDGPLSEDGLRAIYAEVLALTKRELRG